MSQRTYLGRLARAFAYLGFCDLMPPWRTALRWGGTRWLIPPHCRGKAWLERWLPPWRSEHCQNETCFAKERKKGQPKQRQGNFRKKQGMWKPLWKFNNGNKRSLGKNLQNGVLPWPCPCPTRFCFFVKVLEMKPMWKNCEKKKKCCSAWNVQCRLAINTECGRKRERATSTVCSPSVWKKNYTVNCTRGTTWVGVTSVDE